MNAPENRPSPDELTVLRAELALAELLIALIVVDFVLRMTSCEGLARLINTPLSDDERCAMVFPRLPTISSAAFMHDYALRTPSHGGRSGQIPHTHGTTPDGVPPCEILEFQR